MEANYKEDRPRQPTLPLLHPELTEVDSTVLDNSVL